MRGEPAAQDDLLGNRGAPQLADRAGQVVAPGSVSTGITPRAPQGSFVARVLVGQVPELQIQKTFMAIGTPCLIRCLIVTILRLPIKKNACT